MNHFFPALPCPYSVHYNAVFGVNVYNHINDISHNLCEFVDSVLNGIFDTSFDTDISTWY